jgi:hypothetical protein
MGKTNVKGAEEREIERVQLLVRVPRWLKRELKHAAIDHSTTVNDLVLRALETSSQQQFGAASRARSATSSGPSYKKGKPSSRKQ